MLWDLVIGMVLAIFVAWAALACFLLIARPKGPSLKEVARLLPDTVRMLRRLATDRALPRGVRVRLWLLFGYLALPIDLIPDFIPVVGYADDAIIVAAVLRSVVRRAGIEALTRAWPGSPEGFRALCRASGVRDRTRS